VRFEARPYRLRGKASREQAIVGDVVRAPGASFTARVIGGSGRDLLVVRDGVTVATVPVTSDDFVHRFEATGSGRWRLQLMRGALIDTVSSPIWLEPGRGAVKRGRC
jgi:hypothetical protein